MTSFDDFRPIQKEILIAITKSIPFDSLVVREVYLKLASIDYTIMFIEFCCKNGHDPINLLRLLN